MYERSYHAKVVKKDSKIERRERRKKRLQTVLFVIGGIAIIVVIITALKLPALQVQSIKVTGVQVVDPTDIQSTLYAGLEGRYLWIFPKTSIFLVPLKQLQKELFAVYPRLQSVNIRRVGATTLSVAVSEYQPTYLWCSDEATCYFMDKTGSVYSAAPYFSGSAYPKIFTGAVAPLPFSPLTQDQLVMVQALLDRLPAFGITPTEFYFDSEHTLRIAFAHNGAPAILYIDPTFSVDDTLNNLSAGLATDPLQTEFATASKILQYLDVRYDNKVIYKFQ